MDMEKLKGDGTGKVIELNETVGNTCRNVDITGKTCRNPAEPNKIYCIFCLKLKRLELAAGGKRPDCQTK